MHSNARAYTWTSTGMYEHTNIPSSLIKTLIFAAGDLILILLRKSSTMEAVS